MHLWKRLNKREREVAQLLLEGLDTIEIAIRLQLAESTVKSRFQRIYRKLNIEGKSRRVRLAVMLQREKYQTGDSAQSELLL